MFIILKVAFFLEQLSFALFIISRLASIPKIRASGKSSDIYSVTIPLPHPKSKIFLILSRLVCFNIRGINLLKASFCHQSFLYRAPVFNIFLSDNRQQIWISLFSKITNKSRMISSIMYLMENKFIKKVQKIKNSNFQRRNTRARLTA